jgi:hypothetical protein
MRGRQRQGIRALSEREPDELKCRQALDEIARGVKIYEYTG